MVFAFSLLSVLSLVSVVGPAGTWSGALVDSKCYASKQGNVNPNETSFASTDTRGAVRYCSPTKKTKLFGLVLKDGSAFKLAPSGNKKVLDLLLSVGKKDLYVVDVTGEENRGAVQVESITMAK